MSKLTKEQYNLLHDKFSVALLWAVKANCCPTFTRSELDDLKGIYSFLGHTLETSSCGHCVLTMLQVIGKEYFDYENELKAKEELSKARSKKKVEVKDEREADSSSDRQHEEYGVPEGCSVLGADGEEAGHETEIQEGAKDDTKKVASRRSRKRSNSKSDV